MVHLHQRAKGWVLLVGWLWALTSSATAPSNRLDSTQSLFFNYLSVNNGLSQNSVTSLLQDHKGFIWIGTYDGLNRFDGFSTQIKRHASNNPHSLTDNRILCLLEDHQGHMLIGTDGGGLNVYDPVQDRFSLIAAGGQGLLSQTIQALGIDEKGRIWVGSNKGLTVVEPPSTAGGLGRCWYPQALKNKSIRKIVQDRAGHIWIGTKEGLFLSKAESSLSDRMAHIVKVEELGNTPITAIYQDRYHNVWIGKDGELVKVGFIGDQSFNPLIIKSMYAAFFPTSKTAVEITHMTEDRAGTLWISSRNAGLFNYRFERSGQLVQRTSYHTEQPFCNLSDNTCSALLVDLSNTLWVGTYQKGMNWVNLSNKNFYTFHPLTSNQIGELGYKGKYVISVVDAGDQLWIGTSNEGLYSYDKRTQVLLNYQEDIPSQAIISLFQDSHQTIWIGGELGLYRVKKEAHQTHTPEKPRLETVKTNIVVRAISEDRLGRMWLSTWDSLLVYNPLTRVSQALSTHNGLSSNLVYVLYADPFEPVMWAGTIGGGLNRIAYQKGSSFRITNFQHRANAGLSNNHVWSILRDADRRLWIGTDAGLNLCRLAPNGQITQIKPITHPLLKDRKIVSILQDEHRNLWLGSSLGLFHYQPDTDKAKQYTFKDGLQSNTLTEAAYRSRQGWMYFGGINGLNYFQPSAIQNNAFPAQTALVDFKIFNQSISVGQAVDGRVILPRDINATTTITLSHRQNNFLLSFASLHYALPEENRFRYRLEGYDSDWIETGYTQRFAAYSNLDAGQYRFLLTSSNNDGLWNPNPKRIILIVEPAPWATWWAKTLYAAFGLGLLFLGFSYYRSQQQMKQQVLLEKLEKEKVTELNEMKLSFFTNITHELRTPLNLIVGPLQELVNKATNYDSFTQFRHEIVHRNALRLFTLINQVLDLRKIASENQTLMISEGNLVQTIQQIKDSFNWLADQQSIQLAFQYEKPAITAWYDSDKIEKVLFNLLSNAFKYTPPGGQITVSLTVRQVQAQEQWAEISIRDTGSGIAPDEREKVFELFYQSKKQDKAGSGIGLALSQQLMKMHQGNIRLEETSTSSLGNGAHFTLTFPISYGSYQQEHRYESEHPAAFPSPPVLPSVTPDLHSYSVLLVEDHDDLRTYIKECLIDHFRVIEAPDGVIGLALASKHQPDIIITDLMMPQLDGIGFCQQIKAGSRTRHIPVLVHSVKNTGITLQQVLQAGADDFIAKPFDYAMLVLKINNILSCRKQLLNGIYKDQLISPAPIEVPSYDVELLKRILKETENQMADPEFSVEKLCHQLGMSRMHLHRKLHALVGKTTSEFIREVRLKRAAQLLASGSKRISEVMQEVGFISNTHFTRYFKEMYGVSPKDYRESQPTEQLK
ncbi:MAG: two-component regulator propeller domain-containing protein [Bacteroidota bacterium]